MSQPVTQRPFLCNVNLKEKRLWEQLTKSGAATAERSSSTTCSRVTGYGILPMCVGCGEYVETETAIRCPACLKKLNTTQEEFNEQIEVTYMWD